MDFKTLTTENIDNEHICCAISDKKCTDGYLGKKEWLRQRFTEGFVFRKADVRGKVFIEYSPAETAWMPVVAPDWNLIHCFWVSGQYKSMGYGKALLEDCLADSKDKNGVAVICGSRKLPFLSDKRFFAKHGFKLADTAPPFFELWYKPNKLDAPKPVFKDTARSATCEIKKGLVAYYSPNCPFNEYYVNTVLRELASSRNIPLTIIRLETVEQAQNHCVPFTIFSLFYEGDFISQILPTESTFDKMLTVEL